MTGHRPFSELKHKGDPSNRCPSCGSDKIVMVEYAYGSPERYDGVSEYQCQSCGARRGRWTGEILGDDEIESRFGQRGVVKRSASSAS